MKTINSVKLLSVIFAIAIVLSFALNAEAQNRRQIAQAKTLVGEGGRAYNQQDYRNAITKYAQAIAIVPRDPNARFWKGVAHSKLDQKELALLELDAALSMGYERPVDVYRERWKLYFDSQNYAAASSDIQNGLALDPENQDLVIASGHINLAEGRFPEALTAYEKALVRQPNSGEIHLAVSQIYANQGNPEKQLAAAQQAIAKGTQNPTQAFLLMGNAQKRLRQFPEATASFEQALRVKPDSYEIYQNLADLYRLQNKFDEAINISRKALSVFPNDGRIYTDLSWFYSLAERHEEASEAGKAAIKLSPTEHMAFTNLCRAYNDLNRPEMAIRECNRALELKPNDGETLFYLGYSHSLLNRNTDASRFFKRAVTGLEEATRNDRSFADGFYLLGNAYLADGQAKKAIESYRQSADLNPGFARVRYNLGVAFVVDKNKAAATEQYNILKGISPSLAAKLKAEIDR